jgi:hypothetical protein
MALRIVRVLWICLLFGPFVAWSQEASIRLNYLATWSGADSLGEFLNPSGLDVDPSGFVYLADTGNERIVKLDPSGKAEAWIGGFGWNQNQFNRPVAISAPNGLDVFVADFMNHRIQRFDKDLHYLATLQPEDDWPEDLRFESPGDIRLSGQGELFCLDIQNRRVVKFDVQGRPQSAFGGYDAGEGRLEKPERILLTGDRVFVSDARRIAVFDLHGNHLSDWGSDMLDEPAGMADFGDQIGIADRVKRMVYFFRDGAPINVVWSMPVAFKEPVDLGRFGDRLYILDRVQGILLFQWTMESASR